MISNIRKKRSRILSWMVIATIFSAFSLQPQNSESDKQQLISRITQHPEDIQAYIELAQLYYDAKNYLDAESTLRIALDIQRNNPNAYFLLGLVYAQNNPQRQLAIDAFKNAVKNQPRYPQAYQKLAEVYFQTRRYYHLIDDFLEFKKKQPDNHLFDFYLGEAYYRTNQYDSARNYLQNALPEASIQTKAYSFLGLIAFREKKYEAATEYFEKVKDKATFNDVREKYDQAKQIQELLFAGNQAFGAGKWAAAIFNFDAILKFDPGFISAREKLQQAQFRQFFSQGQACERNHNFSTALQQYQEAAKHARPGIEGAQVSEAIGRLTGQQQYTDRVDEIEDRADAQLNIGSASTLKEAKENLEVVLRLDTRRPGVHEKIRTAYRRLIDIEKAQPVSWNDAIVHLLEAKACAPDSATKIQAEIKQIQQMQARYIQINLAKNIARKKDWWGAYYIFAGIYQADNTQQFLLKEMTAIGDSLQKSKRLPEALEMFQNIQTIAPTYLTARDRAADLKKAMRWDIRLFLKKNYGWFLFLLLFLIFLFVIWHFFPGPVGRALQVLRLKKATIYFYERYLKQHAEDEHSKNTTYFLRLGQIYTQTKQEKKVAELTENCQKKASEAKATQNKLSWQLTYCDLLLLQNMVDETIRTLEAAYQQSQDYLIRKKLLRVYHLQLEQMQGNNTFRNRLAELYLDAEEFSSAQRLLEISRQDRNAEIQEKAESLWQKLEKKQPAARALVEWSRKFFEESGFEIIESSEAPKHSYLSVKSDDYKKYGEIRVNILESGQMDAIRIQAFFQEIKQTQMDLKDKITFCVVTDQVTADARTQIFTYQINPGFAIIPIFSQDLRRAVIERKSRQELEDKIRTHTGRENLYVKRTPVTSPLDFFGRHRIIEDLKKRINQFHPVGIYGLRKVGKTSLLQNLKEQLPDPVAFLNLQTERGHANCAVLYHKIIQEFVNDFKIKFPGAIDVSVLRCILSQADPKKLSGEDFVNDLSELSEILKQRQGQSPRLILFIDEIEELLPLAENDQIAFLGYLDFLKILRGLNQDKKLLVPVVASVDSRFNRGQFADGKDNPFYSLFVEHNLEGLSREDTDNLITTIGASLGLKYEANALEKIYVCTGGYPLLTRLLCAKFFERKSEPTLTVTINEVNAAVADFGKSNSNDLEQLNNSLKPTLQAVVKALARSAPLDNKTLLQKIAFEENGEDKKITLEKSLNYLKNIGLVTGTNTDLRLKIGLLREWLNPDNNTDISSESQKNSDI